VNCNILCTQQYTPHLKKAKTLLFFKQLRETLVNFNNFWHAMFIAKKLDVNDYSFAPLTLLLLLHYLVKFRSHSLAIYYNEFILGIARVNSESTDCQLLPLKNICHITSLLLQHVLKMSAYGMTASVQTPSNHNSTSVRLLTGSKK